MHVAPLPSDPVQLTSERAARQLSRMGAASIASKLDDQLQLAAGVVSFVAASVDSALVLPPQAAMQIRGKIDASRVRAMLEDYATAGSGRQAVARASTGSPMSTG
jgi:hypothetical protein